MGKKNSFYRLLVMVLVFGTTGAQMEGNRAVMNPMHPSDMQSPEETPTVSLKAELRMPLHATSEVMELLAEDELVKKHPRK